MAATLEASLSTEACSEDTYIERFGDAMRFMSETAQKNYRALVYETPGFNEYFFNATPVQEIAGLNIGSRPASRKTTQRIEDLRAIPWSFSWAQCRLPLPGWYGVGSGIQRYLDEGVPNGPETPAERLKQLQEMAAEWPFFRTLLSNMEQVLAKTDLDIGARYAQLVEDQTMAQDIFKRIKDEFHLCCSLFTQLSGYELLDHDPALRAALTERFAYIDPLNHLQVELLRRQRNAGDKGSDDYAQEAIHITINGIAAGLRNSG